MKKLKFYVLALVFGFASLTASASEVATKPTDPEERIEQLENRVHEIWKMDFSNMEKVEKVALKEELKQIKRELKTTGLDSKVSISVGAIIIILLIIIIIA